MQDEGVPVKDEAVSEAMDLIKQKTSLKIAIVADMDDS